MSLIKEAGQQISDAIMHNQKAAVAVPVGTAALGTLSSLAQIQSWLTVVSMGLGIVISCVILYHKIIQVKTAHVEHAQAKRRLNEVITHEENSHHT